MLAILSNDTAILSSKASKHDGQPDIEHSYQYSLVIQKNKDGRFGRS